MTTIDRPIDGRRSDAEQKAPKSTTPTSAPASA